MCLAVPAEIIEVRDDRMAVIDIGGVRREASLMLVDEAGPGDYVLVHAGFAIEVIDAAEAAATMSILEELAGPDEIS
jgi:hydrogenase expression/formation protein HypC